MSQPIRALALLLSLAATAHGDPKPPTLLPVDGSVVIDLAGGQPTLRPFGGRAPGPVHRVTGHVLRDGKPVPGALVLVDRTIAISGTQALVGAAAVTDASGAYVMARAPDQPSVAIAFAAGEWSRPTPVTADGAVLELIGHGGISGETTYDGRGESFELRIASRDDRFVWRGHTDAHGAVPAVSLPPGSYVVTARLPEEIAATSSLALDREIAVAAGATAELHFAQAAATTVAITATPPGDREPPGLVYWLFPGAGPKDAAAARAHTTDRDVRRIMAGGKPRGTPMEFSDVGPGTYTACAALFDRVAFDAADGPYGCAPVVVRAGDTVREAAVTLR